MKMNRISLGCCVLLLAGGQMGCARSSGPRFEISFPASLQSQPITGRVFVFLSSNNSAEPRLQAGSWGQAEPFFGVDADQLKPGEAVRVDGTTPGYPNASLNDVPSGDYYVQALMNVYTRFPRSDGHVIWAHLDQWEGQHFQVSPGNIYSEVQKIHLDRTGYDVKLDLTKVIPPVQAPADTEWVKHIRIQSQTLTRFWGHPMDLGAVVLLPKGYDTHPNVHYPVLYEQGHFSLAPPLGFRTTEPAAGSLPEFLTAFRGQNGPLDPILRGMYQQDAEWGYQLYRDWTSNHFPRMIVVTFQHPTPFFDDSYAVNSANNGPYGDAIMQELIPYLESHYRIIAQPYARVLSGGSTGGWESLALQVYHPDFFGGTWTMYPDPIDFSHWQLSDIYHDSNMWYPDGYQTVTPQRPWDRLPEGQVLVTQKQENQMEAVLGTHGRSAQQMDIWFATYGPVGADGYPVRLWSFETGMIRRDVAQYMKDHGYDLTDYIRTHWPQIGASLKDKIHIYCGDMDTYYLETAVYSLQDFLDHSNPSSNATFVYGRPMKPHGWQPMSYSDLLRMMSDFITKHARAGEKTSLWNY